MELIGQMPFHVRGHDTANARPEIVLVLVFGTTSVPLAAVADISYWFKSSCTLTTHWIQSTPWGQNSRWIYIVNFQLCLVSCHPFHRIQFFEINQMQKPANCCILTRQLYLWSASVEDAGRMERPSSTSSATTQAIGMIRTPRATVSPRIPNWAYILHISG